MKILALEPYYGGSHKAFLDGWIHHSAHAWTLLDLPANKWKWRMRHSAINFAADIRTRIAEGQEWDLLFCSDMLNLAEFIGLAPEEVRVLPKIIYFHENQLSYPVQHEDERDLHFAFMNFTSALAADAVWFNSAWHQNSFLDGLATLLRRMPSRAPKQAVEEIKNRSTVWPQGIEPMPERTERKDGPLHILWAARWEHDKNPDEFFAALSLLKDRGQKFRLSVIGETFGDTPPVFAAAAKEFADETERWGFQEAREDYITALGEADVIVSTAHHEFFGISVVEAINAGCYPLVPDRLAYPEVLGTAEHPERQRHLYQGGAESLASHLSELCDSVSRDGKLSLPHTEMTGRYTWPELAPLLDKAMEFTG